MRKVNWLLVEAVRQNSSVRNTLLAKGGAAKDLVGLLGSEISGLLCHSHIYVTILTGDRAHRDGYYVINSILCEYPTRQEARDSSFCVCGKER